ncbi:MAG: hypothetical protein JOY71_16900 [Acetobacteraceae bacterium]|nr:hypothetical protein [Acetobacteraceae bacterium]MBV8523774.1 hypothetical protein [Acetobacteraceae bacterium]
MRNLLLALALVTIAACRSDYNQPTDVGISSRTPANPTGSVGYQPGSGSPAGFDPAAPSNPTGSMGYQGSGGARPDTITAAPPGNPTGSAGYQR